MSNTQLLLDTLSSHLPQESVELLESQEWKHTALNYLDELLNSDNIESLLDTSIMPDDNHYNLPNQSIGISEQIAEFSNASMIIDDQTIKTLIKGDSKNTKNSKDSNLSIILNNNSIMTDSFENFDHLITLSKSLINSTFINTWKSEILLLNNHLNINSISTSISVNNELSLILQNLQNVIEILELPSIIHSLIKLSQYSECIEISSLSKRLKIRYNNIKLITQIENNINFEVNDMILKLSGLLETNLKQSSIIKILSYLKKTLNDNKNQSQLKSLFLHLRYKFIIDEFDTLLPLRQSKLYEKFLKRCIEIFREFCFQTIIIFTSIFENDSQLINSFLSSLITKLCEIINGIFPLLSEQATKDSLLLQLVYCCQSLTRVGGDFTVYLCTHLDVPTEQILAIVAKQKQLARSLNHV